MMFWFKLFFKFVRHLYLLFRKSVDGDKVCIYIHVYLLLRKSVDGDKVCRVIFTSLLCCFGFLFSDCLIGI